MNVRLDTTSVPCPRQTQILMKTRRKQHQQQATSTWVLM